MSLLLSPARCGSLIVVDGEGVPLVGEFDPDVLSEALKWISLGALKMLA